MIGQIHTYRHFLRDKTWCLFLWAFVTLAAITFETCPAAAQSWEPLRSSLGTGGGICAHSPEASACLVFRCDADRGLEFVVLRDAKSRAIAKVFELRVDGNEPHVFVPRRIEGVEGQVRNFDAGSPDDSILLVQMAVGNAITLKMERDFILPLKGARAGIEHAVAQCATREYSSIKTFEDLVTHSKEKKRYDTSQYQLRYLWNTDSWGNDIDSGLTNPALDNISANTCIHHCVNSKDCTAITYNKSKRVCFLKSRLGSLRQTNNASTVVIVQRPQKSRTPLVPGAGPVFVKNLRAAADEPWQSYVSRLRDASLPLGGNCQQEADELARVARSFKLKKPERAGEVDVPFSLEWQADLMRQRIPAWLVVSIDKPARFEGDGFYALNAGALAPFGMQLDVDRQRAFVPLFEGALARAGSLQIRGLQAGTYTIRMTLVSYLRVCKQELPLMQSEWTMDLTPGAPQVVIRDLSVPHPFKDRFDVPEFGRRIVMNEDRFQLQNLEDGSEILTRGGKQLRLSPTKRFVVVRDGGLFEIIDIVDGKSLATVTGVSLAFWNADSFFISEMGYYGKIYVGSTMRPRVFLEQYGTGPSCCMNGGSTELVADLENNLLRVNNASWSLLDGSDLGSRDPAEYYPDREFLLGEIFPQQSTTSLGMVAPVTVDERWSMPLGPRFVEGFEFGNIRNEDNAEDRIIAAMASSTLATVPNENFGRNPVEMASTAITNTVLRGMPLSGQREWGSGFAAALERWNINLAPALLPETVLDKIDFELSFQGTIIAGPAFQAAINRLEFDLYRYEIPANWSIPTVDNNDGYCSHFGQVGSDPTLKSPAYDLNLAYRFDLAGTPIWITRANCSGGATGGSIMHMSELVIYDPRQPASSLGDYIVENGGSMFGRRLQTIIDVDFKTKLFGRNLLVTYSPGEGVIMAYDLQERTFVLQVQNSRRGDLLADVFVDNALQHLFQLNTDGSFSVFRLSDGAVILEGRYLDDELVVWTADFRFDATEEGASFVELRFPGKAGQYSFQQFRGALYVPDLLENVLAGRDIGSGAKVPGIPPEVNAHITLQGDQIIASIGAVREVNITGFRLFQDGILTHTWAPKASGTLQLQASRQIGARWATLIAENDRSLLSVPISVDLGADPKGQPNTFFLGVGVDYYAAAELEALNYAKVDALRIYDTITAMSPARLKVGDSRVLVDRKATKESILNAADALIAQASPGDNLILFFAGHGLRDKHGKFYLGLSKTDPSDLAGTALNWNDVAARFKGAGLRVTVLLDACHSGAAASPAFATNDGAVAQLSQTDSGSLTIISAAKGRQFSGESAAAGGGFFTKAIVDVLSTKRKIYDTNNNGVLEIVEFYRGVKRLVVSQTGQAQTPWLSRSNLVGEYVFF